MITLIILAVIGLALYFHFEPQLDKTSNGDTILWYNSDRRTKIRKFIKLW